MAAATPDPPFLQARACALSTPCLQRAAIGKFRCRERFTAVSIATAHVAHDHDPASAPLSLGSGGCACAPPAALLSSACRNSATAGRTGCAAPPGVAAALPSASRAATCACVHSAWSVARTQSQLGALLLLAARTHQLGQQQVALGFQVLVRREDGCLLWRAVPVSTRRARGRCTCRRHGVQRRANEQGEKGAAGRCHGVQLPGWRERQGVRDGREQLLSMRIVHARTWRLPLLRAYALCTRDPQQQHVRPSRSPGLLLYLMQPHLPGLLQLFNVRHA